MRLSERLPADLDVKNWTGITLQLSGGFELHRLIVEGGLKKRAEELTPDLVNLTCSSVYYKKYDAEISLRQKVGEEVLI